MNQKEYDVAIIGGGPAGCALALRLEQISALSILLIDRANKQHLSVGESIPPDSRKLLQKLALWSDFEHDKHAPCFGSRSIWGDDDMGFNDFVFNPTGHGWHLDRHQFDHRLINTVEQRGISYWHNSAVTQITSDKSHHLLKIKSMDKPNQVSARFVVDATGKTSRIAKKFDKQAIIDDELVCITGFFTNNVDNNNLHTDLEAVKYGWWYASSLPQQKRVVALACDRDFSKRFGMQHPINWQTLLKKSTQWISKNHHQLRFIEGSLRIDWAPSFVLNSVVGSRWLATGDAACAFDPIAAGGIYKALAHGIQAAETIAQYWQGRNQALENYNKLIQQDFAHYLRNKKHLYGQEQRWPDSPFWRRRQQLHQRSHHKKSLGSAQLH